MKLRLLASLLKDSLMFLIFGLLLITFATALSAQAQNKPQMAEIDRIRLAEAFRIGEQIGDKVWRDWSKAPFAVLLVTPEHEFLIRHPKPSKDFAPLGYDALLKSDVYHRARQFPVNLLATFPAVGGIPTIVIGQAENTSQKTSTSWVITVLHEHFHQLQSSQPDYYAAVGGLDLTGGDQTGMWMLNYAFPYKDAKVKEQFAVLSRSLAETLQTRKKKEQPEKLAAYLAERRKFEAMLAPSDYKYFSFQSWQEGIARYTEYKIASLAANKYKPSKEFRALKDYQPFKEAAPKVMQNITKELTTLELDDYGRPAFYPLGAGEGLLLDKFNPNWQSRYFTDKFYIERYFI